MAGANFQNHRTVGQRFDFLIFLPRVLHHPSGGARADANAELLRRLARENSQAARQVLLRVKTLGRFEPFVERGGLAKAIEFEVTNASFPFRRFAGGGDDVQTRLVEYHGVRLDLTLLRRFDLGLLIVDLDHAMFENSPVNGAQNAMMAFIRFGRHAAHVQHPPVLFVMIPDPFRQGFFHFVPERFDALPERRSRQRVEQVATERERDQLGR